MFLLSNVGGVSLWATALHGLAGFVLTNLPADNIRPDIVLPSNDGIISGSDGLFDDLALEL